MSRSSTTTYGQGLIRDETSYAALGKDQNEGVEGLGRNPSPPIKDVEDLASFQASTISAIRMITSLLVDMASILVSIV
jgi:hypothetical protein